MAGGRLASDRRAAANRTSGQCFTSLAFSADGAFLLAGGASKCALDPGPSALCETLDPEPWTLNLVRPESLRPEPWTLKSCHHYADALHCASAMVMD